MADAANLDRGWLGALRTLVKPPLMRREMHRKLVDARRPSVSDGRQCSQFIAPDGVVPSVTPRVLTGKIPLRLLDGWSFMPPKDILWHQLPLTPSLPRPPLPGSRQRSLDVRVRHPQ
jgi:hypothetical protein